MHQDPAALQLIAGAQAADVRYFMGDVEGARDDYRAALLSRGGYKPIDEPRYMVGFGLTSDDPSVRQVLVEYPYVFREVRARIITHTGQTPDPAALAKWLHEGLESATS